MLPSENVSMSNSAPEPPVKVRNSAPVPEPLSEVETLAKVSKLPVFGTATVPRTVPVWLPERMVIVPPGPPEETAP